MSHHVRAIIRWIPAERGGRLAPPTDADGYSAPAHFESDPRQSRGVWSLRLWRPVLLGGANCILATVAFLAADAPEELLVEGARFELVEGALIVAKGVVLPSRVKVPDQLNEFELALLG